MGTIASPCGGFDTKKYQVIAKVDGGATVVAIDSAGKIKGPFKVEKNIALIRGLANGAWTIRASIGDYSKQQLVTIEGDNSRHVIWLHLNMVPDFEATSILYRIVDDEDAELNEFAGTTGAWKIRFEKNTNTGYATVVFSDLHGQNVDIFLCGGGGAADYAYFTWGAAGGGGGYTITYRNIHLEANKEYRIVVGEPGQASRFYAADGSIDLIAAPGEDANGLEGGNGGCGGGGGHGKIGNPNSSSKSGNGGSNGQDGTKGTSGTFMGADGQWYDSTSVEGKGQISKPGPNGETGNTYEFGEAGRSLYSSGGAGGSDEEKRIGVRGDGLTGANSGAGGSSNTHADPRQYGFSGIVIIRNAR